MSLVESSTIKAIFSLTMTMNTDLYHPIEKYNIMPIVGRGKVLIFARAPLEQDLRLEKNR